MPNHLLATPLAEVLPDAAERAQVEGRCVVARRLQALPIEAVVRGYLIGSGWKDYLATGAVCGIALPPGLAQAQKLPQPIFTPATKAAVGDHDENISFDEAARRVGHELADARARYLAGAVPTSRHCMPRRAASSSPTPSSSSGSRPMASSSSWTKC